MINPFSILFRYLLLEMIPPFLINLGFFSFIFLMKQILDITDMIVNHKVGLGAVCLLLVYTMPYFLQYVVPMSVMMAILLTFLRMSGDNEIMALKASGVSIYRLLPPVVVFSLMGVVVTGYMTIAGIPSGAMRFQSLLFDVATANLNVGLKERTFNDNFKGIMLYVNKIDPRTRVLQQVLIEDTRTPNVSNTVVARRGKLFGDPRQMVYQLRLYDGTINQVDLAKRSSQTIDFSTYDIRLDLNKAIRRPSKSAGRPDEMTLAGLDAYLKKVKGDKAKHLSALITYYRKFSIPAACLAMGLLALPLGLQRRHASSAFGIGLGLFFFLLYYVLLSLGSTLGESGRYPPAVAMWMPNVILGGFGLLLLFRAAKEKTLSFTWLDRLIDRAIHWTAQK